MRRGKRGPGGARAEVGKAMALESCRFPRTTHRQEAAALQGEQREGKRCEGGGDRRKGKGALWDGRTDRIQDEDAIFGERRRFPAAVSSGGGATVYCCSRDGGGIWRSGTRSPAAGRALARGRRRARTMQSSRSWRPATAAPSRQRRSRRDRGCGALWWTGGDELVS